MSVPDPAGLELVEAEAIADAFGADAVRLGGAVCALRSDLDEASINRVVGLGVTEPAAAAVLDRIADVFGPVRHSIALAPSAQPAALPDMLRERGYDAGYAWVKFHRPAALPFTAPTGLRVERIGAERAGAYVSVLAAGFGIPAEVGGDDGAPSRQAGLGLLPGLRRS